MVLWKKFFKDIFYKGVNITVSNYGKIIYNNKQLRWRYNHDGYAVCNIKIPNKGWRSVQVHILVAIAFVPNPNNLPEVNHKDYNRANPTANNLEWMTHAENVRYSNCNRPDYTGSKNPNYGNHKLSENYKDNKQLSKLKQGRPATQNGRSIPVDLYYDDVLIKSFDYMLPCCQYLIDIGITNATNPESVRSQLNKCIKNGSLYKKHYRIEKKK